VLAPPDVCKVVCKILGHRKLFNDFNAERWQSG
jgi:hypothetical protein